VSFLRVLLALVGVVVIVVGGYVAGAWLGLYGEHEGPGAATEARVPDEVLQSRVRTQQRSAAMVAAPRNRQILFGDLHVHTTFSTDAFLWSLPMMGGEGTHPLGHACDYARFCSALDFWSINDHAEAGTPRRWQETKEAIRQCNALGGDAERPDVVAFLGWEWSQVGQTPEEHYGHKNVIVRGVEEDEVPARVIGAGGLATTALRGSVGGVPLAVPLLGFPDRQRYYNFNEFMQEIREVPLCPEGVDTRELPHDCYEAASTPGELFEKLDQWGLDTIVIPHGNTWGYYTPPGATWDKQLTTEQNDPERQGIIEIMSGHGNSEEYRDWRAVNLDAEGNHSCPEPNPDYLPSCWRAGEIIAERCRKAGLEPAECESRAAEARQNYAATGIIGHLTVPGVKFEEWLDSGQCKDCFVPSFNYRPGGSVQYALAISNFDDPDPKRFRFGFIASSDIHRARPGTGYKEYDRKGTTEANGLRSETWHRRYWGAPADPEPRSVAVDPNPETLPRGFRAVESERFASFFVTGGLAAVHVNERSRSEIWDGFERKEVYGTSGDRILLWFDVLNAEQPDGSVVSLPMGSEARTDGAPRFRVRAIGAFKQKPGCPAHSVNALSPERLERLCKGECYNPSDERKPITRIEIVRIRPQITSGEPVAPLIQDPWRVFACEPSQAGCVVQFEDSDFVASGRPAVYYARAFEAPSPMVNGKNLRCDYDASGRCVEVHPCYGGYRTDPSDDCVAELEERAWSSPIYVDPGGE
jgi:hypothetical protein